jgi:rod shape-determining protein MreC
MLFTWGMLAGLIFLFAVPQETAGRLQLTYARVFRWPLATGRGITLAARPTTQPRDIDPKDYADLVADHRQLQNRLANLQAELQETRRKNELLARLRERPEWENMEFCLAGVITAPDPARNELIINRGTEHGVAVGQFVVSLSDEGRVDESVSVIGTISSVESRTAKIRLITDKGSQIIVGIAGGNLRGFMEGQGNRTARIPLVSTDHQIAKGDPVYAQKQAGLDVPVVTARVVSYQKDRDHPLFWNITVEPVCDIAALSDVAVVLAAVPRK